jgi:glucosamine kinase
MVLIADGGSTKTNWCLVDTEGTRIFFNTEGYNPEFIGTAAIIASLRKNLPSDLIATQITELYYYGASIDSPSKVAIVADAMRTVFPQARIYVDHDLLAAARALLGRSSGFASILGTGTNSCLYNGENITYHVDSLGYFLGDEGSGSFIGKRLLRDYLRQQLPPGLQEAFRSTYQLGREEILDGLYNQPLPNRFLASFAKFAYDHNNVSYCRQIVADGFEAFFQNIIMHYPSYQHHTLNCIGSVAYNFRDVLTQVANAHGMAVGKIIRSPIDDLVTYHLDLAKAPLPSHPL